MKKVILLSLALMSLACDDRKPTSDKIQQDQQESILKEGTASVGMPAIKNFRERRLLKDILEMRDQEGIVTYTYLFSEQTGKLTFLGQSIGFGIPYATQFTNPQKVELFGANDAGYNRMAIPQADPNGLFSPASAEGTWVMLSDPKTGKITPTYIEPRIIVSTFPLPTN